MNARPFFMELIQHDYMCPYCFETIETTIDPSVADQSYIEDCQVCCNPIEFTARISNAELVEFRAERME